MLNRIAVGLVLLFLCTACGHNYRHWTPRYTAFENKPCKRVTYEGTDKDKKEQVLVPLGNNVCLRKGKPGSDGYSLKARLRFDGARRLYRRLHIRGVAPLPKKTAETEVQFTERKIKARECTAAANSAKLEWMYGHEFERIRNHKHKQAPMIGLALSGGGVRSASFATGVLRGLHEIGMLSNIGYLSSVSGGGYAASWYMIRDNHPDELFAGGSRHLDHLAQHGNYLSDSNRTVGWDQIIRLAWDYPCGLLISWFSNLIFNLKLEGGSTFVGKYSSAPQKHYRRGLAKAYQYKEPLREPAGVFGKASYFPVEYSIKKRGPSKNRPYWIVNMHVSLKDDKGAYKGRSGDALELTPDRAGGTAVGYIRTEDEACGESYWMSMHYAVPISGAAVDSAAAQVSVPDEIMSTTGLNLGYWVAGWGRGWTRDLPHGENPVPRGIAYHATAILPPFNSVLNFLNFSSTHNRSTNGKKYYLSDGGHFDVLGLYALVRRGVRLIIVSDAGLDNYVNRYNEKYVSNAFKARAFEDLRRVEVRLQSDFGARVTMKYGKLRVFHAKKRSEYYDDLMAAGETKALWIEGRIKNLPILRAEGTGVVADSDVRIIYIKAAYNINGRLRRTDGYIDHLKAQKTSFPQDNTINQFFTERQVVAYRELARDIVRQAEPTITKYIREIQARRYDWKAVGLYANEKNRSCPGTDAGSYSFQARKK